MDQKMDGKKMSFAARIVDDPSYPLRNDIDGKRDFVLTYYVVDGTMGIYEPMRKNSGLAGRKYLERMRVKKPTSTPLYYQMQVCPRYRIAPVHTTLHPEPCRCDGDIRYTFTLNEF